MQRYSDTRIFRNTGNKDRIWQSDKEKYYETVIALMSDQNEGELCINDLKILTSKESKTENTQYYIQNWPEKKPCQITNFPHPYPQLASLQKEMIRYQRNDGVQLTATLYLPPGYDPSRDGPLPCLVWSYPGEFKSKDAAGQVRGSPNEFAGIGPTSPLLWLARRYAFFSLPTESLFSFSVVLLRIYINIRIILRLTHQNMQICCSIRTNHSYNW